jgi:protoporphyrinogen oxidase
MGELSNYLAAQLLNGTVHLHSPVSEVTSTSVTLNSGEKIHARSVVVATEGPTASVLLNLPPVASRSVSCVYFSADTSPTKEKLIALDGSHSGPVLNMAVMSNISSHYAPQGKHLIAAACPGVTTESEPQLVSKVTQQLLQWWGPQVNTALFMVNPTNHLLLRQRNLWLSLTKFSSAVITAIQVLHKEQCTQVDAARFLCSNTWHEQFFS